jgi:hypothetical protein
MNLFNNNEKKYNIFILLSSFAYGMAEIYVPVVLYNKDYSLKYIFLYFVVKYALTIITYNPVIKLGRRATFKWLLVISAFTLGLSFYLLSILDGSLLKLLMAAITFAIFTQTYWLGRHYYAIEVLAKKKMSNEVGNIIILSQLATIPSAYLGALAIESLGLKGLTVIITVIVLLSIIPIFLINEKPNIKSLDIKKVFRTIPKSSLLIIMLDQFRLIIVTLFPLYIFLNIIHTYRYIGEVNVVIGIASAFFVYFFSHKMDEKKDDYLHLATFLLGIVFLIKLNIVSVTWMMVIALAEGLVSRMQLTSLTRNMYILGKNYDTSSYLALYEIITNIMCTLIYAFGLLFFPSNLKVFLYIIILIFMLTVFLKFYDEKIK